MPLIQKIQATKAEPTTVQPDMLACTMEVIHFRSTCQRTARLLIRWRGPGCAGSTAPTHLQLPMQGRPGSARPEAGEQSPGGPRAL